MHSLLKSGDISETNNNNNKYNNNNNINTVGSVLLSCGWPWYQPLAGSNYMYFAVYYDVLNVVT